MTDNLRDLRDRIEAVQKKHLLVRYDRAAWWCQCGDDCLSVEGSHSRHVADAVIEELGMQVGASAMFLVDGKKVIHNRYTTEWIADE